MTKPLRCAIYTRKSSEEGLEQEFNSLHAQREACEAYIKSQRHEGWSLIKTAYDDGGISGGTMQRPALRQLLEDIEKGKVDVIVVYKVDRLTRALADFARMVELFDRHDVSFVSVTQQFNTTSSMGRLTLNVLLSFAQFEREVTGERIRDKVKASKAKGIWMGGSTPIGYQVIDKKLLPHPEDAETVRAIFQLYLELGNVRLLVRRLEELGLKTRERSGTAVKRPGRRGFTRGALYAILKNPVYLGKTRHGDKVYGGQHDAIVSQDLWDQVQTKLADNAAAPRWRERVTQRHLLLRKLVDSEGNKLVPSQTTKRGRRYRYYISEPKDGKADPHGWRLAGERMEDLVFVRSRAMLNNPSLISNAASQAGIEASLIPSLIQLARNTEPLSQHHILDQFVDRVTIHADLIAIVLNLGSLLSGQDQNADRQLLVSESQPIQIRRRFNEMRLVMNAPEFRPAEIDDGLVRTIACGHVWFDQWQRGEVDSLKAIAEREGVGQDYVTDVVRLAFLAPCIVEAIVQGKQPPELSVRSLLKLNSLPMNWDEQAIQLGCQ